MSNIKNRSCVLFALVFVLLLLCSILCISPAARADTGPKPSVHVRFSGLPECTACYGTLLSKNSSTGPAGAWDGDEDTAYNYGHITDATDRKVWRAYAECEDVDGYYYLQHHFDLVADPELVWGYYPPTDFKIALYFPETATFVVSEPMTTFAFHSYYSAVLNDGNALDVATIVVEETSDDTTEAVSLIVRILVTIIIELAIALLFGFRARHRALTVIGMNIVTQTLLNLALNAINPHIGIVAFVFAYLALEVAVFSIEATAYCLIFAKIEKGSIDRRKIIIYALTANAVSYIAGFIIAYFTPGFFV